MQDRYTGDANDFVKYLVLRHSISALRTKPRMSCVRLGIAWYLTDPAIVDATNEQDDGGRIQYLLDAGDWRCSADQSLFSELHHLFIRGDQVCQDSRAVAAIESSAVFPTDTLYFSEQVPADSRQRSAWYQRCYNALAAADFVFLDPDNSVSDQSTHPIRGGKWASVHELVNLAKETRSVAWISHPRVMDRVRHHLQEMAKIEGFDGLFCSIYQGHCGLHFLLSEPHRLLSRDLQELVRRGVDSNWGTWRYMDSDGGSVNAQLPIARDEQETVTEPDRSSGEGSWEYHDAVVINDHGNLWRARNSWLNPDGCLEVVFLLLDSCRLIPVDFEPFRTSAPRHGLKPVDAPGNKSRWNEVSDGASNSHIRAYPALVRRIECGGSRWRDGD